MKKKIVSLCLVVALIAIAAVGTLAYFTDSKSATNTFTVGNVAIGLDEAPVIYNKDTHTWSVDQTTEARVQANTYENVYPGAVLPKDPIVHNTGTSDAYVQAEVRVAKKTIACLFANDPQVSVLNPQSCFENLVGGELGNGWSIVSCDLSSNIFDFINEDLVVVLRYAEKVAAKGSTTPIFSNVTIPTSFDGKIDPATFTMNITAQAIQADGFDTAAAAFTELNNELNNELAD